MNSLSEVETCDPYWNEDTLEFDTLRRKTPAATMQPSNRQPRKIAIVGHAPSSMSLAPYSDASWEIWGLGNAYGLMPRWDRWFELHGLDDGRKRWASDYWTWLTTDHGKPLYINAAHPDLPHAEIYPRTEVCRQFGNYFTNSVSWMLALAIQQRPASIALYGVDMAEADSSVGQAGEYQHQRPSCEYIIGFARGLGIEVIIPESSDLLKAISQYGFDTDHAILRRRMRVRDSECDKRIAAAKQQIEDAKATIWVMSGAKEERAYWWRMLALPTGAELEAVAK